MRSSLDPDWSRFRRLETGPFRVVSNAQAEAASNLGPIRVGASVGDVFRLRVGVSDLPDYGLLRNSATAATASVTTTSGGVRIEGERGRFELATHLENDRRETTFVLSGGARRLTSAPSDAHFARRFRLPVIGRDRGGWLMSFDLQPDEPLYGVGERWGRLDLRGQLVRCDNQDALGVNSEASYKHVPLVWNPRGWGVLVHTPARVSFGAGFAPWSQRALAIYVEDDALDVLLIAADSPAGVIQRYHELTGPPSEVPLWTLGAWWSRAYYRDTGEILEAARGLREQNIPGDVIALDGRAWQDTATRFHFGFDTARYPDPRPMLDELHALNFRVCVWQYPLVSTVGPHFAELEQAGALLRDGAGATFLHQWDAAPFGDVLTPLPTSGIVDFTRPEAARWWSNHCAQLFELGIDAIEAGFGEQVPDDAVAANGDTGARLHNVYPLLYSHSVFEAARQRLGQGFVLSRSGWTGAQRYPIQWGGDPQADWGGLAGSIRGALSWGMSGQPCYAHDVGGYYADARDAELYVRWTQTAVFGSHIRFHGIGAREPWHYGEQTCRVVRNWLVFRYRLLPYIEGVLEQARTLGLPAMRAMPLVCPDEPEAWPFDLQYGFGPDFLIVPTLRSGGRFRGWLPRGRWHDFWSGEATTGGRLIEGRAPLDRLPVYVREGAVIPMGPAVSHIGELVKHERITELRNFGTRTHEPCLPAYLRSA